MDVDSPSSELPVAVLGAGPVGLAAAAHLFVRGLPYVVFERGEAAGASIREWAHVQLFSPWRFNIDAAARCLLERSGWDSPAPEKHPTGGHLVEQYLRPLAALPEIKAVLRTNHRVVSVTRLGVDKVRTEGRGRTPFVVTTEGPLGIERTLARAVIDASGTWLRPNPIGADGRPAIGEAAAAAVIVYGIPDVLDSDRSRYAGQRVAVIGAGHSAKNAVRDLAALANFDRQTTVTWVVRRADGGPMFGGRTDDQLPERARLVADAQALVARGLVSLETAFHVEEIRTSGDGLLLVAVDGRHLGPFDRLVGATGFRPDLEPLSELRLDVDSALESARALAPLIDPNVHSCGSVPPHGAAELAHPEPGLYVVGAKSYGRAPTFLLSTGYGQVRSVVAELAGDLASARNIRPVLPKTGVCSPDKGSAGPAACSAPPGRGESAPLAHALTCCG